MARISNCFLLFVFSVVLGVALAATHGGQHFEKESTASSRDAVDGYAWRSSNLGDKTNTQFEMTTRGVIDTIRSIFREILQNIVIALDCYLKTPNTKSQQEQYKKVAESIKHQLLQALDK